MKKIEAVHLVTKIRDIRERLAHTVRAVDKAHIDTDVSLIILTDINSINNYLNEIRDSITLDNA